MVASIIATAMDGVFFAFLMWLSLFDQSWATGLNATLAAVVGGIIHYSLCSFWVFERFEQSHLRAIPMYIFVSGMAALLHGLVTQGISMFAPASVAWGVSKVVLFLCWTYPLSRYAVFGQPSDTSAPE